MNGDQPRILVIVASGESLLDARNADRNGRLHSVLVVPMYLGTTAPRHELRVARNIGHQVEHLPAAVGDEDGALYSVHRYGFG